MRGHLLRTISRILVLAMTGGCAVPRVQNGVAEDQKSTPLQLWSGHESLEIPIEVCGDKAFNVLTALGFSSVVRNGNFAYGNFDESRAAVKCVDLPNGSFVYFAVASAKQETAEDLRNRIAWKF